MTSILMEDLKRKTFFFILASSRTPPPLPPPVVVVVDSPSPPPPPPKRSCCDFCFKCESGYSWYDLHGKGRYSNAFRASLGRAYCSL